MTAVREIKILKTLDHQNILKLHDIVSSKSSWANCFRGSTFLVLDYMDHDFLSVVKSIKFDPREVKSNSELKDSETLMNEFNKLNDHCVKCLMKQILEGTAYLHQKNIMHRDMKSGNLLMNSKGEVKIADFGLARIPSAHNTRLTKNVVTLWYRAPEVLYGDRQYTLKVDMWSIGYSEVNTSCIFAEILTKGDVLFYSKDEKEIVVKMYEKLGTPEESWEECKNLQFYQELKPRIKYAKSLHSYIRQRNPDVDPAALDLLDQLLIYNPAKRISAKEALVHPWFNNDPLPCQPHEIQPISGERHEYAQSASKHGQARRDDRSRADFDRTIGRGQSTNDTGIIKFTNYGISTVKPVEKPRTDQNKLQALFSKPPTSKRPDQAEPPGEANLGKRKPEKTSLGKEELADAEGAQ